MKCVASVIAVCLGARHRFSKQPQLAIELVAGHGVAGDAHAGAVVQHRYSARRSPGAPNLRQVHLLGDELFAELEAAGIRVAPGDLGENVTTGGIDLAALPRGTRLRLGSQAVVEVTGLRDPCVQLNRFAPGLMRAATARDASGAPVVKGGVMAIVLVGGAVRAGDAVVAMWPAGALRSLGVV